MTSRPCLGAALLALTALSLAAPTRGQAPDDRPSHRPILSGLEEDTKPEDRLNQRLAWLRHLKKVQGDLDDGKLDGDLQQLARKLMKDEKFMRSLKGLNPEELRRLKERFEGQPKGGLTADPALQKLLKQGLKNATLGDAEKDLLKKWAKRADSEGGAEKPEDTGKTGSDPPLPPNPDGSSPTPAEDQRSAWEKALSTGDGWLNKNVDRFAGRLNEWLDTPGGKRWQGRLAELGRRALQARSAVPTDWAERTKGAVGWLPRLTEALPTNRMPRLPGGRLPNVPSLGGMPSAPNVSPGNVADAGKPLLILALMAVVAVVVWRLAGGWIAARVAGLAAGWRLGPWPVRPEAVASRGDLVRAFEYLALLILGPVARTWNHLEVGQRLGEQPDLDADRRREAAGRLAHLYEQARYAPEKEPLPPAELEVARRELCYLAGVPSA